jgi:hypothetical protein
VLTIVLIFKRRWPKIGVWIAVVGATIIVACRSGDRRASGRALPQGLPSSRSQCVTG